MSGTTVPVLYLLDVLAWQHVKYLLLAATVVAIVLEGFRLSGTLDLWVYRRFTREYEKRRVAGYALALIGAAITAWAFDPFVAVPALLMLTIADPVSGILSRDELAFKQGFVLLATFGICLAIASILRVPFVPALAGAGAATLADGMKPTIAGRVVDDNLTIPIASGLAMSVGLLVV